MKSVKQATKFFAKTTEKSIAKSFDFLDAPRGVRFTETELVVDQDCTDSEWNNLGRLLVSANKASSWWLGDWMVKGPNERRFKESMDQTEKDRKGHRRIKKGLCVAMAGLLGLSPGHISNLASVCKRVSPELRKDLTPGHAVVILQNVPEREFPKWRNRVIKEGLSCAQLRQLFRKSLRTEKPSPPTLRPPIFLGEVGDFVRKFSAESATWTDAEWAAYQRTLEPIMKAFSARGAVHEISIDGSDP